VIVLLRGEMLWTTRLITIASMLISVVVGVFLYAIGDFLPCIMDIENNTGNRKGTLLFDLRDGS
jgi:hypothetical protein